MKFELLHIDACPNWTEAADRLTLALAATGHSDASVTFRLLRTPEEAADVPFAGSPTISLDGADLFPTDGRTVDLACHTPTGLAGAPTVQQPSDAITSHEH